jgi:hypothetical protein
MRKIIALFLLLFLACQMSHAQSSPVESRSQAGIVLTAEHLKTNVFEMQITGITHIDHARSLDAHLRAKYGVVSANTVFSTQVCKVEVRKDITALDLQSVVEAAGFKIAKKFNP